MLPKNTKSIMSEFRLSRNQSMEQTKEKPTPPTRERKSNSPYETFLRKYQNLENTIDDLGTRELVYYFREVAEENGVKYVISNIKKDMAIIKRLKSNYDNREICGMIEFLFESEQDYLEKDRVSINILGSQWINTIYADMKLWVEDKYTPKSKKIKKDSKEWNSNNANIKNDVNIGITL